jgi:hypothetical protein
MTNPLPAIIEPMVPTTVAIPTDTIYGAQFSGTKNSGTQSPASGRGAGRARLFYRDRYPDGIFRARSRPRPRRRQGVAVVESYFDVAVRPQLPAGGDPFRAL